MTAIMPKDEVQKLLDALLSGGPFPYREDVADAYRSLIAAHDETERLRADAQAAVAMAVERAAENIAAIERLAISASIASCTCNVKTPDITFHAADCRYVKLQYIIAQCEDFRDLVPTDGLTLVAELRADVTGWAGNATEAWRLMREAEAERDRLAADNARLAAQVETLTGAALALRSVAISETPELEQCKEIIDLDAALDATTVADMTPQEQLNFHAMMGQRRRLKPNPDGTIPATGAPEECEWNARYDAAWPAAKDDKNG